MPIHEGVALAEGGSRVARDPLPIVEEYLGRPNPKLRRHAVTALAAIGDARSLDRLIHVALEDPSADVRAAAEAQLRALGSRAPAEAVETWRALLDDQDKAARRAACALVGRLAAGGAELRLPALSVRTRLRLGYGLRTAVHPRRRLGHFLRPLLPALAGATLWLVLLSMLLDGFAASIPRGSKGPSVLYLPIGFALVWVLYTLVAAWRTVAIGYYVDRPVGVLTEVFFAGLFGVLAVAVVHLLLLLTGPGWIQFVWWDYASLPAVAAATRLGTLLAAGGSVGSSLLTVARLLLGFAAGVVVMSASCILDPLGAEFWTALSVLPATLASAFTVIDMRGPRAVSPSPRPLARALAIVLVAGCFLAVAIILYPVTEPPPSHERRVTDISPAGTTERITKLPYRLALKSDANQTLVVTLTVGPRHHATSGDYRYAFCGPPAAAPDQGPVQSSEPSPAAEADSSGGGCRESLKIGRAGVSSVEQAYVLRRGEYRLLLLERPTLFAERVDEFNFFELLTLKTTRLLQPEPQREAPEDIRLTLKVEAATRSATATGASGVRQP
jgi:hypothetical protein